MIIFFKIFMHMEEYACDQSFIFYAVSLTRNEYFDSKYMQQIIFMK